MNNPYLSGQRLLSLVEFVLAQARHGGALYTNFIHLSGRQVWQMDLKWANMVLIPIVTAALWSLYHRCSIISRRFFTVMCTKAPPFPKRFNTAEQERQRAVSGAAEPIQIRRSETYRIGMVILGIAQSFNGTSGTGIDEMTVSGIAVE